MSSFTENTSIQPLPKSNRRVTTREFTYYLTEEWGESVTVPVWYEFDWASVPCIFWMLIQRVEPKTISSACLHDYLYTEWRRYSRSKTDKIFKDSLLVSWCSPIKSCIMRLWVVLWWRAYWYKIV